MHPAYPAIFFTTCSGLGYGLLVLLGVGGATGVIAPERDFGLAAFGLAFAAVTLGLFAPTLQLRHPARAWRVFGQWRSSRLSREALAAAATYLPTGIFALGWIVWEDAGGLLGLAGLIGAALALFTVYCTAMIYAGFAAIAAWSNRLTVPGYLILALATGSLWLAALARLFALGQPAVTHLPVGFLLLAWIVKAAYWSALDSAPKPGTRPTAPGPGRPDVPVADLSGPQAGDTLVTRGMGRRIARRRAVRLRRIAQGLAFAVPLVLTELEIFLPDAPPGLHAPIAFLSAILGTAGVAVERWLFFAEAGHVVAPNLEPDRR